MILSLTECQSCALVFKAVPLLRRKGITVLLHRGGANEDTDGKRVVRAELANDWLWNTVCGLLDDAYSAPKDAEAREMEKGKIKEMEWARVEVEVVGNAGKSATVPVIPGTFESVVNARWSHVLFGGTSNPLGMRVVDGLPEYVWSYNEVNCNPSPLEDDKQVPRNGNLEIMVLSSEDGWPYTQFRNETRSVDNNAEVGRGGVFKAPRSE
ncbi:hypothetical protein, conserved in T. vivax, partial [Trypanosoma vivax Y486]